MTDVPGEPSTPNGTEDRISSPLPTLGASPIGVGSGSPACIPEKEKTKHGEPGTRSKTSYRDQRKGQKKPLEEAVTRTRSQTSFLLQITLDRVSEVE
jgi:hypothetical protein